MTNSPLEDRFGTRSRRFDDRRLFDAARPQQPLGHGRRIGRFAGFCVDAHVLLAADSRLRLSPASRIVGMVFTNMIRRASRTTLLGPRIGLHGLGSRCAKVS